MQGAARALNAVGVRRNLFIRNLFIRSKVHCTLYQVGIFASDFASALFRLKFLRPCNLCLLIEAVAGSVTPPWVSDGTALSPRPHQRDPRLLRHASAPTRRRPASSPASAAFRLRRLASGVSPPALRTYHLPPPASLLPPSHLPHLPVCRPAAASAAASYYPLPACTDMAFYSPFKLMVLCALLQAAAAEGAACRCVYARLLELYSTTS